MVTPINQIQNEDSSVVLFTQEYMVQAMVFLPNVDRSKFMDRLMEEIETLKQEFDGE